MHPLKGVHGAQAGSVKAAEQGSLAARKAEPLVIFMQYAKNKGDNKMDFIRDPLWQFVGAVLAVLAIIISIALFLFQRRTKTLAYEVISRTAVLSASEEIAGKLQILFQGETVRKVHLLVLRLVNNGNVPITSADYEREVSFVFSDCEKILSAEISETTPSKLLAEIVIKEKSISIKPLLLNPGDSIAVKTLISGFEGSIDVDGRVIGVNTIGKKTETKSWSFAVMIIGLIVFSAGLLFLQSSTPSRPNENPFSIGAFILGYAFMFIGMMGSPKGRKRLFDTIRRIVQ